MGTPSGIYFWPMGSLFPGGESIANFMPPLLFVSGKLGRILARIPPAPSNQEMILQRMDSVIYTAEVSWQEGT